MPIARYPRIRWRRFTMLAGTTTPDDVLRVGDDASGTAKFYADLYVGLYYEALGRTTNRSASSEAADSPRQGQLHG